MTQPAQRYAMVEGHVVGEPFNNAVDAPEVYLATDYLALEAERDRWRDQGTQEVNMYNAAIGVLEHNVINLMAERDALRADARRYRWLRDVAGRGDVPTLEVRTPEGSNPGDSMDTAIDSALATQEAG